MRRLCVIAILFAFILTLGACQDQKPVEGRDPVLVRSGAASRIYVIESVEDIAQEGAIDVIVVAKACTPGEYEVMTEGGVLKGVGPVNLDMRVYGAVMEYEVEEVLRGNLPLAGTTIKVWERLYPVEDRSTELRDPLCAEKGAEHAVICLRQSLDGMIYYNTTPEWFFMPIKDNGELEAWPYINRTHEKITLDDFRTMCKEGAVKIEEENRAYREQQAAQNCN